MQLPMVSPLRASHFDCRACDLSLTRTHIVDGAGPLNAPIIIIGEAPGADEDKLAVPFVGRSGKLLRAVLSENGIYDGHFYLTNMVKCRPPDNRDPTDYEIGMCGGWLLGELQQLPARVILALGKIATAHVTSLKDRGLLGDKDVYSAYHPAYILRSPRHRAAWSASIGVAALAALGEDTGIVPITFPWRQELPDPRDPYFAADTETDDLQDNVGVRAVGWSVSDGFSGQFFEKRGDYAPLAHRAHTWLHNAKYDAPLLGIDLRRLDTWDDTMLAAYVLRYPRVGLKLLSPELAGMSLSDIGQILGRGKRQIRFSQALRKTPAAATRYACEDAVATSRIARVLAARLHSSPTQEKYYREVEKPAVPVLYDLERRGILVDPDYLAALNTAMAEQIETREASITSYLGDTFNRRSTQQLAQALINAGITLRRQTKTGKWRLDEAVLGELARQYPDHAVLWDTELQCRKLEKLLGTYGLPLLDWRDPEGRVHARYNQAVTQTSRLSSSDPNLQNIPIRTEMGKMIRKAFIPRPGCVFVKADASQLEVRVYAEYTLEPVLVDAYTHTEHDTGGRKSTCLRCDVHQGVANSLGITRDDAKNTLFASIYGAEDAKLAATARVPLSSAADFLARMRENIPSLLSWKTRISDELDRQGYVETLLGWREYYPLAGSPIRSERAAALREAGNNPIQGTGAGIIKVAMTEADLLAYKYEAGLIETVHDEVGYEVPERNVVPFARELKDLFRQVGARYLKKIPFLLEVSAGPNWGDCEAVHDR